jgi:hypothetical protein
MCYALLISAARRAHLPVDTVTGRRFIHHVNMGGPIPPHDEVYGPCWDWTGAVNDDGYGVFRAGPDQLAYAHVWAAEQVYGEAPPGHQWDHRCHHPDYCDGGKGDRHRRCANPAHTRLVTARENKLRGNGPTAINARKTHCVRNHALSGANVYTPPKRPTERRCRACAALARARSEAGARAARDAVARLGSREAPRAG